MGHYTLLLFLLQVVKHGSSKQGLEVLHMGNINQALVPGFADLILKFCIAATNVKQESGPRSAFRG